MTTTRKPGRASARWPAPAAGPLARGLLFVLLCGCFWPVSASLAATPLKVTVSILPQAWFVSQIGGDLVEVSVLVGPGHSPATYEPTPRQMANLEQADLFLAAGVPFEQGLLPRIRSLPDAPLIAGPEPAGGHHHHDGDPHTWLDPRLASALADTVSLWLRTLAPEDAAAIKQRRDELQARLVEVDAKVKEILAPYRGRTFIVFHPAFGHFAEAFGLIQVAVEDDGHQPGPRHLAEVIQRARECGARSVIVQPQFSTKSARTVAEAIGAEIVELDPLAEDYETNLLNMALTLAVRFAAEDAPREGS